MPLTYSWPGVNILATTTDARKNLAGLIAKDASGAARSGIFPAHVNPLITARSDMNIDIALFTGAAVQFGGPVLIANDGVAQLPSSLVSPGAGTNYYVVYAKQNESTSPGSDLNNNRVFGAQLSTTSFAVARAALPAGALELGTVEMPTGKTATNQAGVVVTPTHRFTATEGGVVLLRSATEQSAWTPHVGSLAYRIDTNTALVYNGTAWVAVYEDTGWITPTLLNSWTADTPVAYRRKNGVVYFKGRLTGGGTAAAFNLPAGFRIGADTLYAVQTGAATSPTLTRVVVNTSGDLQALGATQPNLALISYIAEN